MAEFNNDSRLLYIKKINEQGQKRDEPSWVYYKKLEETSPSFYNNVYNKLTSEYSGKKIETKKLDAAEKLFSMAKIEKEKELSLIKKTFGPDLKIDLNNPNDVKEFIKAFQDLMQYKGVAERAKTRLEKGEKHISIAPFLEGYLLDAIEEDVRINYNNYLNNLSNEKVFATFFAGRLQNEIWKNAADKLAKSNNLRGHIESGQGYYEFFNELIKRPQVLQRFFIDINKDISFSSIVAEMYKDLKGTNTVDKLNDSFKKRKNSKIRFITGGTVQETLLTYMQNLLMRKKFPNVVFDATKVGGKGARPDIVAAVGLNIPIGQIEADFNKMIDASREEARLAAKRVMERLDKANSGFLIYTNVKNYGLDSNTQFKGTENMKLQQYYNLLSEIQNPNKLSQFVTAIMNTLSGAMAENEKSEISELIAQDIAYFLFDDYEAIGAKMPRGAQTIHMFSLSDFYVPLSTLLQLLANSFKDITENPKNYANITIYSGEIAYPEGPWGIEQWRNQRSKALNEIELGIRFFKNFKQWIEEQIL